MQYIITEKEKRFQGNIFWQFWRFIAISWKFFKLTRQTG
jgi:hypothetical protein